jgi:phage-related protein
LDVFNLYAKLSLNTDDYEKGIEKAKGGASSLMDVFSGTLLGNVVSDGLRTVTNGITKIGETAANMAVSIGKASLDSYGNYEQLVGGVETLYSETQMSLEDFAKAAGKTTDEVFMEWSDLTAGQRKVWNDAADAYKTVGMSMNEYMDTATSFAAALVSSLGGDTKKAADMANIAITDMADNANKMGTNMQSIQDAYNGFAKQNYTMLDNLKLGYGGTKTEMERLVKEASTLTDVQKELGVTVDGTSLSYSNIVSAIHVVQANMGILGTTSKEASTTILGSTASMRAAWENMLVAIADPEQDVGEAVDNLVESVIAAGKNIVPRIQEIVPTLVDGISELATQLTPYVSGVIMELEPTIEEGLQALLGGLSSVANELQPIVADVFSFLGDAIVSGLTTAVKNSDFSFLLDIFDNVKTAVKGVVPLIEKIVPALVTVGAAAKGWEIGKKLQSIVTGFDEAKVAVSLFSMGLSDAEIAQGALNGTLKASEVVAGLLTGKISLMTLAQTAAAKAQAAFNAVLAANPIALVVVAIGALVGILAVLYAKNEDFRSKVNAAWESVSEKVQGVVDFLIPYIAAAMDSIKNVVEKVVESLVPVAESIGQAFSAAWDLAKTVWSWASAFFSAIVQAIITVFSPFAPLISGIFSTAFAAVKTVWGVATSFFQMIFNVITGIFAVIDGVLTGDFSKAWEGIKGIFGSVFSFFDGVGNEVVEGIKSGISAIWGGLVSFVQGLWDGIKSIFVIDASDVKNNTGSNSHRAGGLDYVPYNGYAADLHRGEMVLTAREAEKYRNGGKTGGDMVFQISINGMQFTNVSDMAHALANDISHELEAQTRRKAALYG